MVSLFLLAGTCQSAVVDSKETAQQALQVLVKKDRASYALEQMQHDFFAEKIFKLSDTEPRVPQETNVITKEEHGQPLWKQVEADSEKKWEHLKRNAEQDKSLPQKIAVKLLFTRQLGSFRPESKKMKEQIAAGIEHQRSYMENSQNCCKGVAVTGDQLASILENIFTHRCSNKLRTRLEEARCKSTAATLHLARQNLQNRVTRKDFINRLVAYFEHQLQIIGADPSLEKDPAVQEIVQKKFQELIDEDRGYYEQEQRDSADVDTKK